MRTKRIWIGWIVLASGVLGACSGIESAAPLGEASDRVAPANADPLQRLYPGTTRLFERDDGGFLSRAIGPDVGADRNGVTTWLERTSRLEALGDEGELSREARLGRDAKGVLLLESLNPARGLRTVFEPPLRLAPSALVVGEWHEAETSLRLFDGDGRARGDGAARVRTERLPAERVVTPMGVIDAHRIDVSLELQLGNSRVSRVARYAVGDDGIVVIDASQRVVAMGFTVRRESFVARATPPE
ncbi:MAG: hypothetical protein AAGK04_01810 [Planctomycetota bacterium]